MRSRPHDHAIAKLYRKDPYLAIDVFNEILKEGDQAELLTVLRQLIQAYGDIRLMAILKAMGLRLKVQNAAS